MNTLPKNHPIRVVLESAASGRTVSNADLDRVRAWSQSLPAGQSFDRWLPALPDMARTIKAESDTGNHQGARAVADAECARMAAAMTPEQRAADGDGDAESLDAISRRMFNH